MGKKSKKARDKSHPLERIRSEVEHVFENLAENWQEFESSVAQKMPDWVPGFIKPKVDAADSKEALEFQIEMPGLDPSEITVTVERGVLVIKGEKNLESEEKGKNYYLKERSLQRYYRSFSLPVSADETGVSAKSKNGLLIVRVPYRASAAPEVNNIEVVREG